MSTPHYNKYLGITVVIALLVGIVWLAGRYQNGSDQRTGSQQVLKFFSSETTGLSAVVPMSTVELKDGDTYDLAAQQVRKNINGQEVKMLAYNGSIPGPLIKVPQGAEITVNFTNNTDVETTLHSHGVRMDNAFDGIPGITQDPIPVGGSFTYQLKFPDAGMYWYHPHIREDYAQELGLYGNFLVEPEDTALWSPVNREVPLMLDDILIENGQIAAFAENDTSHTLMGRFGNVLLINGETSANLTANPGEVVRFFITNTANTRTFKFSIPGAQMKLVGSDGGTYEKETFVDSVTISPSERATVDVLFVNAGTYSLQHATPQKTYPLGTVIVSGEATSPSYASQYATTRTNVIVQSEMDELRPLLARAVDKSLNIGIDMGMMNMMQGGGGHMMFNRLLGNEALAQMSNPTAGHGQHMMPDGSMMSNNMMMGGNDPIEWEDDMAPMNVSSNKESVQWKLIDEVTGKENMEIDWKFKVGDKVKIRITNDANSVHPMQHPIHLHGQRFLVTNTNGIANDNLVWKDTTLIQTGDTVELLVDMTNPGEWMLHCHIAEHLEDGMMMPFTVL
ncbi:MAG: multicopper oxidase family protein [Candidatus Andersenbacteria bacterium]